MNKSDFSISFIEWRFKLIILLISLIVVGLILRIIDLTIIKQQFLREQGNERAQHVVSSPAFRGIIADRNGLPLAISTSIYSVWISPKEFSATPLQLKHLSTLLNMKSSDIKKLVLKNKKKHFVYLKRNLDPALIKKIQILSNNGKIKGIYYQESFKRFYPEGEVTAHLIGLTNVDDQGQEGLELSYNGWLTGTSGKKLVTENRRGQTIAELRSMQSQKEGNNLFLSIDKRIQYLAYRELMAGVTENNAKSGSVVVLDVKTGEVLAMANVPSFNPNGRSNAKGIMRNIAVTDVYEPASTIKSFSVAVALNSGKYHPETVIDTMPGWVRVGKHVIRDEHRKGLMTVTQILQYSSDVGVAKMILSLPPENLWNLLHQLGFGEQTGIGFPGERSGSLVKRRTWAPLTLATLSFGYGISATALQIAHAYATLANDGVQLPLSLLKIDTPPKGEPVMDARIANQIMKMLESVLEKGGTAEVAHVPGYRVAGKTGTTKELGPGGYQSHQHTSTFVGIAPLSHPRFVVLVVIHEPHGKEYYGGTVSGPVFKRIMQGILRIENVPPDGNYAT